MNIIQIFGDYIHLLGMIILLVKLCLTKNCTGISGKTQLLTAVVFTARYTDLTIRYISLYNTILKIIYISIAYCTVLAIFLFFRKTYDRKRDAFRIELLVLPCAVFALFMNHKFATIEVFWTFSVYLEALAIIPQIYLISKSKEVESIVVSYVSCLGLYRGCYLMHWTYEYFKFGELEQIAIASGIVQLIFYCDFFARNLPILKPKHQRVDQPTRNDREGKRSSRNGNNLCVALEGDKIVELPTESSDRSTTDCKDASSTSASMSPEEKITLLAVVEGTSNDPSLA